MFLLFFLALCYSCTTFFLIRHIYIIHAETKRLLSCDRKLFLLYVVNSRLKKFFCCLLQGIILSSQITNIYLTLYFSLVAICQWPLSSLRIPPDPTPLYPYESSPSQKLYPKSLKNQTPQKWLSRNRTAKVIPFYYTTKLFTNFFWRKIFHTQPTLWYTHDWACVFFVLRYRIPDNITLLYRRYLTFVWQTVVSGYL